MNRTINVLEQVLIDKTFHLSQRDKVYGGAEIGKSNIVKGTPFQISEIAEL